MIITLSVLVFWNHRPITDEEVHFVDQLRLMLDTESDTSVLTWAAMLAGVTFRWMSYCWSKPK